MNVVITVVGADRPGIVSKVSTCLYENNVNILDINQTVMQGGVFTMSLLADCAGLNCDFTNFKENMDKIGEELSMDVRLMREEIFISMHRI